MKKLLFFVTALLISASMSFAQDITLSINDDVYTELTVGQDIFVPLTMVTKTPGYDVIGFDFFMEFDHTILQWKGTNPNPLPGVINFNPLCPYSSADWTFNDFVGANAMVALWQDPTFMGANFPDGSQFFTFVFTYLGGLDPGETTQLTWQSVKKLKGTDEITYEKGATAVFHQFFDYFNVTKIDGSITLENGGVLAPVADFMGVPTSGDAPLLVNFTDMSTGDPADAWEWNFGDGSPLDNTQNPMHVYAAAGMYTVSLTASNAGGSNTMTKVDYIVVNEPCVPGTWTGFGDGTDWFDPMNWSCDMVPENVDVTIPGGSKAIVTISGGVAITANLTIAFGGGVTVAFDGGLTTNGLFTNDGAFLIETDGANGYSGTYIDNGGIAGAGTFQFNREMFCTGTTGGALDPNWHYLAGTIDGFSTHSMFDYYVNAWSEATSAWVHVEGMAPNCIPGPNVGLGTLEAWSINYANDYSCGAINPGTGMTLEFMGGAADMHTGAYGAPATFTPGAFQGWNMFANPYPSGLDMSMIAFDPNMVPGAAYWDGCLGNYMYWSIGLGFYPMAPGLGFFTEWTAPGVFGLAGTERVHGADWFWKADVSDLVTLQISGNEKSDITHIRFMENAQVGFAKDGDFHKLFSTEVPQIYTTAGEDMLAVNCLPETASVPMGMISEVSESYTISAIETSDFQNVVLEDLLTGAQTDLLVDSYSFEYNVGEDANRFVVHFTPLGTSELSAKSINIWAADHNIYVQAPLTTGDIVVYNMMGQEVVRTDIEAGLNVIPMRDVDTYYIVKVIGSDITETGKVFIK